MSCSIKAHAILSKIRKDLTHTGFLCSPLQRDVRLFHGPSLPRSFFSLSPQSGFRIKGGGAGTGFGLALNRLFFRRPRHARGIVFCFLNDWLALFVLFPPSSQNKTSSIHYGCCLDLTMDTPFLLHLAFIISLNFCCQW